MQNIGNIMKQAKKLQERMTSLQDELALKTVEASAGGGGECARARERQA